MQSSKGAHWIALDHIRALAAFFVFTWHFVHAADGHPVGFDGAPLVFPLAVLDEGHTGVALFMTLSGYLFAKLLDGKSVDYPAFLWNRFLRLAPLLFLVLLVTAAINLLVGGVPGLLFYLRNTAAGFVIPFPRPPYDNGIWSIIIEVHFYIALPLLLVGARRWKLALLICVAATLAFRASLFAAGADAQLLGYWTIIGRLDQFVLGIFAYQYRHLLRGRHWQVGVIAIVFCLFLLLVRQQRRLLRDRCRDRPRVGLGRPADFEAMAYATLISYYDGSYSPRADGISGLIAKAGAYSYSIYLLHFVIVFAAADFVNRHVMQISNFYVACLWSLLCFCLMVPIGRLSYVCIEEPFLRRRRSYLKASRTTGPIGEMAPALS